MLLVYTGDGKGKTSAAVGQTIRALGQGFDVAFCQFMKRPGQAGEQALLRDILHDDFLVMGKGFLRPGNDPAPHRQAALETLAWALKKLEEFRDKEAMLIMDEAIYALNASLLEPEELERVISLARERGAHLVLTGRGLPPWLEEQADLVTAMQPVKHPYEQGIPAQRGIEF